MTFDPEKLRESFLRSDDEEEKVEEPGAKEPVHKEPPESVDHGEEPKHGDLSPDSIRGRLIGAPDDPAGRRTAQTTQTVPTRTREPLRQELEKPAGVERLETDTLGALRSALLSKETTQEEKQAEPVQKAGPVTEEAAGKSGSRTSEARADQQGKKPRRYVPPEPPSPLSRLTLMGGAVSLVASAIAALISSPGIAPFALSVIGAALVAGFLLANRSWVREGLTSRSARYSANVATVVLSLLGIVILINIIGYQYHYRFDLSSGRAHSLSPQSLRVLGDINRADEKVTVTAFAPSESGIRDEIQTLADRYLFLSRELTFSFVDPDIQRELSESKGITRVPSILFELGDKRSVISDIDEAHFTSALMAVRKTESPIISFLAGHNEPDPYSVNEAEDGLSMLRDRLELENYEVNQLRIPESNGIPAETKVLIIVNPRTALHAMEIDAIGEYLKNGGSMICMLEPGNDAGLSGLLAEYGIAVNNDVVLDDERNFFGDISSPVLAGNYENPITSPPGSQESMNLVFLHAGSLGFTTTNRLPGVIIGSLVKTYGTGWSETSDEYRYDQDTDKRESLEMALMATLPMEAGNSATSGTPSEETPAGRESADTGEAPEEAETGEVSEVMAVNDSSFVLNANIDYYDNSDFILNAVNHMAMSDDLVTIRAPQTTLRPMEVTKVQASVVFAFSVVLTPLLIAAVGGLVWWRRR